MRGNQYPSQWETEAEKEQSVAQGHSPFGDSPDKTVVQGAPVPMRQCVIPPTWFSAWNDEDLAPSFCRGSNRTLIIINYLSCFGIHCGLQHGDEQRWSLG